MGTLVIVVIGLFLLAARNQQAPAPFMLGGYQVPVDNGGTIQPEAATVAVLEPQGYYGLQLATDPTLPASPGIAQQSGGLLQ